MDPSVILLTSLRSIGTAASMAAVGVLLVRLGLLSPETKRGLARLSMNVTIPALLFANVLDCTQDYSEDPCPDVVAYMRQGWPLLLLPAVNVGAGMLLGKLVCCLTRPAANFRKSVIAAVAFGNSTGLPITLLSVIHASFAKTHPLGRINPTLFLAVYLIPYPVLQWVAGGYLMGLLTPGAPGGEADPEALARVPSDPRRSLTVCLQSTEHFLPDPEPQPPPPAPGAAPGAAAQYAPMDVGDEGPEGRRCRAALRPLLGNLLQPPVVATLLGLLIALTHGTAVDLRHVLVDTEGRRGDAVLQWWFNAVLKIGQAAVPMNMFILGAGLGSFDWGSVKTAPWATNALVVLCKMVLMPCVGVLEALLIRWAVELDGPADSSFFLVVMVVTVTPTANNIAVMAEVAGQDPGLLSTCVFLQYVCAPFLLTMSVAASVAVSQSL